QPGALPRGRPEHPHLRLRRGDPRPDAAPRSARSARPPRARAAGGGLMLDVARFSADFPLLAQRENGHPLVYLDNAATTQKPQAVLDAILEYYRTIHTNLHRRAYIPAFRPTEAHEA